ncbi:MAG: acyl-CoA dehydrogenase family protein [Oligosphaeraceae bacterium]
MANYFHDYAKDRLLDEDRIKELLRLREPQGTDLDALYRDCLARLEQVGQLAAERVEPRAAAVDDDGAQFRDGAVSYAPGTAENLRDLKDAGLMGVMLPREYGGLHLPVTVYSLMTQMISRADASLQNLFGLQDIAQTIRLFGSDDQKQRFLPRFATGEFDGAMALTEPDAGSDLQSVQTSATLGEDGVWRIRGLKHFITNGCAKVLLVLARSEAGTRDARGLSLFIVQAGPAVVINRIEDKLGIHGSPTCEVQFNDAPAELLGQRRFGLIKYVMSLMNGARLAISSQAAGLAEAAQTLAHAYTAGRTQFGHTLDAIPPVADMLERIDAIAEAERVLLLETCHYVDLRDAYEQRANANRADADAREKAKLYTKVAALMTPLTKFFNTEGANAVAYDTIQCMGGKGYMHERLAERYYRDARIMNIYEGTSQMQVVAATGGLMTHVIDPIIADLFAAVADVPGAEATVARLRDAQSLTDETLALAAQQPSALLERLARHLLRMQTIVYVGLLLVRSARRDADRLALAKAFVRHHLPDLHAARQAVLLACEDLG